MSLFDQYSLKARYLPAMIIAFPLIMLTSLAPPESYKELFQYSEHFMIVANVGLNVILILFLINIIRELGKSLVAKKLFKHGLTAPTTEMLLWGNDQLSDQFKERLHAKISKEFDVDLFDRDAEKADDRQARILARDTVGLIRKAVGNGQHVLQYNIRYGFWRNLVGGLPLGILFAIGAIIFVQGSLAQVITGCYLAVAAVLAFTGLSLLRSTGATYAEYLLTEYLSEDSKK